jgi:small subunit ribosomal protein S16
MLEAAGVVPKKERNNPKKGTPGEKAVNRAEEKAAKAADANKADAPAAAEEETAAAE